MEQKCGKCWKYDKVVIRHSTSISKFKWFEQLWANDMNFTAASKDIEDMAVQIIQIWKSK